MLPSIMVVTLKFLISSEKSLQVQLDYSVIINHIQMHENKFCLHICDHLKGEKRGRSVKPCELGEMCICITFGLNKRAENDLFRAALTWTGACAPFIFHSNHIQIRAFFIFLIIFLKGRVINLIGYVHFGNKLMSTHPSSDLLCILIGWMQNDIVQCHTKGSLS